jgi:hypothetical protein
MSNSTLLPTNATRWEAATSLAMNPYPRVGLAVQDIRSVKWRAPPLSFRPYLIYEYGLGPVARFFEDQWEAIQQGIPWQRVRGTPDAVSQALDWIGYEGEIEAFPPRRRRWNLFMLELGRIRDAETPDLNDIDYLAQQSVAERSRFWRGFRAYDVRALEYGRTKISQTLVSSYSGARVRAGGAKWSFGRTYERDYTPTQANLVALGVWLTPDSTGLSWGAFPWTSSGVTWTSSPAATRARLMAAGVLDQPVWVRFRRADNSIIGHRRARVARGVLADPNGIYQCGAAKFSPNSNPATLYIEALTQFGDGNGSTAASWSLLFNPTVVSPAKPGIPWATAAQLTGGVEIMTTACSAPFGQTVRERFKAVLRF